MKLAHSGVCVLGLVALVGAACRSTPQQPVIEAGRWERTMEAAVDGQRLGYLLEVPAMEAPDEGWPLLLFLHGIGERGDDPTRLGVHGPPKLTHEIPELARCVLLAPQCPADAWWQPRTLKALLDEVCGLADVDASRLYVTGLSMGGYGTWALLSRYPELFAAAVPICGGGDTGPLPYELEGGFDLDGLLRARSVPIRVFHGEADSVVPVEESRVLVRALQEVGADVHLTVYPGVGHDSWTRTYADRDVYAWLFVQRRGK